jgi:ferrous iron transport protein A
MYLDAVRPGTLVRIIGVEWPRLNDDEARRLQALGVDADVQVRVLHRGIFGMPDPLAIRLGSMTIALRRAHAAAIAVEAA